MKTKTLQDLFLNELADIYDAEIQPHVTVEDVAELVADDTL
jgi:ferritin-like metal-binding protein YciE